MKTSLFVSGAAALLLLSSSALAEKQHFVSNVTAAAELPPPTGVTQCAVTGACSTSFTYDTVSHRICGHVLFDKAIDVTAAHIHSGAADGTGPVVADLGPPTGSQTAFAFDVTASADAQTAIAAAAAEADDTVSHIYFNVHTTENPNGAVRGNFHPDTTATSTLDECIEIDADKDAGTTTDSGVTTTPTDGGGTTVGDSGTDTTTSSDDSSSSCSTAPGTSPGSVMLMLGAAIAVGSIVRSRKKR